MKSQQSASTHTVIIAGLPIAQSAMELLRSHCRVQCTEPYVDSSELAGIVGLLNADGILVRTGRITREVMESSSRLRVIAKHGIGIDNIDVRAANRLAIPVLITPSANYESVAEHVLGLMLCLARDIPALDSRMREGHWDKSDYRGVELQGKTLGLVGFGRIGRRLMELVAPLKMRVLVYDPYILSDSVPPQARLVERLEELLAEADIVSLHCPLTKETRHLIGKEQFRRMKSSAWLINTARGEIVEEEALVEALLQGEIAAAALDTFPEEPPQDVKRLCTAGRTILTPHVAGVTEESMERMGLEAARNILDVLQGRRPPWDSIVNPEVFESTPKGI